MDYENNPRSIKFYVKRYLLSKRDFFRDKKVVDFPAGNGVTSKILHQLGAIPIPLDLFPEYFNVDGLNCQRANIRSGLPLADGAADAVICQEGIEHFSDQYSALKEFNRVLIHGGILLVTTPNYSNIRSRLSYFLAESERFPSTMPPNELDSVWMADFTVTNEVYFGHLFLLGAQKLRTLARLSGFKFLKLHPTQIKSTSLLLFPVVYPFIFLVNFIAFQKNLRKNIDYDRSTLKQVYREVFRLSVSPRVLMAGNLMMEFEKVQDAGEVCKSLKSKHKLFGTT